MDASLGRSRMLIDNGPPWTKASQSIWAPRGVTAGERRWCVDRAWDEELVLKLRGIGRKWPRECACLRERSPGLWA